MHKRTGNPGSQLVLSKAMIVPRPAAPVSIDGRRPSIPILGVINPGIQALCSTPICTAVTNGAWRHGHDDIPSSPGTLPRSHPAHLELQDAKWTLAVAEMYLRILIVAAKHLSLSLSRLSHSLALALPLSLSCLHIPTLGCISFSLCTPKELIPRSRT